MLILSAPTTGDVSKLGFRNPLMLLSEDGKTLYSWAQRPFHPLAETRLGMDWTDMQIASATREILEMNLTFFGESLEPPSTMMLNLAPKIVLETHLGGISNVIRESHYG